MHTVCLCFNPLSYASAPPQETPSSAVEVAPGKLAAEEASFQRAQRLAQIKQADRNLMAARAAAAILKSKLKMATEREEYILSTLRGLAAELLCKPLAKPPSLDCIVMLIDELMWRRYETRQC
jgi:hypothetical protein